MAYACVEVGQCRSCAKAQTLFFISSLAVSALPARTVLERQTLTHSLTGVFGDVVGLGTSTPTLYVHFPQGRLRLSGARVFPNARYVMLRVGKAEAAVEEVFDSLVSFSEFAWVGQQADNPDDEKLEMPAGVLEANVHGSDLRTAVAVGGSSDGGGSAKRGAAGRRSRAPVPGPETATQPQMQDEGDFFLSQQSTQPASQATRVEDAADGDAEGASASGEDCGEAETSPTPRRAASRRSGRERGRVNYAEADGDDSEDDDSEDVDEIIDLCSDD